MQPEQREYEKTTRFSGPVNLPEQTYTHSQCVTREHIEQADTFLRDTEQCRVENRELTSSSVAYTMVCPSQQGGEMRMDTEMQVMGDRVSGEARSTLDMNGQSMDMVTRIEGRRVGGC
jgi:hypothetical protein